MSRAVDVSVRYVRPRHRRIVLAIVLVSFFMVILDNSIVFTGLPRIREDLGFSDATSAWIQTAYAVPFAGLLLVGARTGDLYGRRRMFVIGLALFGCASTAIAGSPTVEFMIIARAVQGIGAAILAPATLTLLTANFSVGKERTRAMAAYGAVAGIGASVGLVFGGFLADAVSWRMGFLINLPIAAICIIASLRYVAETPVASGRLDVRGAVTVTLGMTSLVFGIVASGEGGPLSPLPASMIAAGLLLLSGFVIIERRVSDPMLPLSLFSDLNRSGAYMSRVLFVGAMFGFFFYTTQYLQGVLNFSSLQAGLVFIPMTGATFLLSVAVPRLTLAVGNTALICAGSLVAGIGMSLLSRLSTGSGFVVGIVVPMLVIGIGQGLALGPLTAGGLEGVKAADQGVASGIVNSAHQFGVSLGTATVVAVASAVADSAAKETVLETQASAALAASAVFMALAMLVALGFALAARQASRRITVI